MNSESKFQKSIDFCWLFDRIFYFSPGSKPEKLCSRRGGSSIFIKLHFWRSMPKDIKNRSQNIGFGARRIKKTDENVCLKKQNFLDVVFGSILHLLWRGFGSFGLIFVPFWSSRGVQHRPHRPLQTALLMILGFTGVQAGNQG